MDSCTIIAAIVTCTLNPANKLPPSEAVKLIAPYETKFVETKKPTESSIYVLSGNPNDGPYGSFPSYPIQVPLTCCSIYRTYLGDHRGGGTSVVAIRPTPRSGRD